MPTALIAEDETLLAHHLQQELQALWPDLDVVAVAPHGQAAVDLALQHRPQVCFLDIRMPGMTGLEAAARLADDWPEGAPFPLLVFVTAYDQYAVQAFERSAVDYVLKPVQRERLARTVDRLRAALPAAAALAPEGTLRAPAAAPVPAGAGPLEAALAQLRTLLTAGGSAGDFSAPHAPAAPLLRHLQVAVGQSIVPLPVEQIVFLEAADKYVRVLTADQEYLVRASLRELLPQLDPERFWQVHRGHVVQVDAIDRALRDEAGRLTLKLRTRDERLAVSRMFAHRFKAL